MGPYCKFCGQRCFIYIPTNTPRHILDAYFGRATIIATCPAGKAYEKAKIGYCLDDIPDTKAEVRE